MRVPFHVPAVAVRAEWATVICVSQAPRQGPDRFFHISQFDESFEQRYEVRGVPPTSQLRKLRLAEGESLPMGWSASPTRM